MLKIHHLSQYLPYQLKFKTNFDHLEYLMSGLDIKNGIITLRSINNFNNKINISIKKLGENKPILKNIKDIQDLDESGLSYAAQLKIFTKEDLDYVLNQTLALDYLTIRKLIEWKFDVFDLIKDGLAIDEKLS